MDRSAKSGRRAKSVGHYDGAIGDSSRDDDHHEEHRLNLEHAPVVNIINP